MALLEIHFPQPAYPFNTGYAEIDSVVRYINAGTWDPSQPNSFPTTNQVIDFLVEATSLIDAALASRGYTIPLSPSPGYVPPTGITLINGLHPAAYLNLRNVAAHYAAAMVEAARHGSAAVNEDPNAKFHMQLFDDFISRLETGADNLTAFGVAGPFPPELDPAHGEQTGTLGAFVQSATMPDSSQESSVFTRATMQF